MADPFAMMNDHVVQLVLQLFRTICSREGAALFTASSWQMSNVKLFSDTEDKTRI
jgi:hypothetical protein